MGRFCPPGDIWHGLETCFTITAREVLLASSGQRPGVLLNSLRCTGSSPQPRKIPSKRPALARLRNLDLDDFITCQPEWANRATGADSEKAVLCSLIKQAPQWGCRVRQQACGTTRSWPPQAAHPRTPLSPTLSLLLRGWSATDRVADPGPAA